MSKIHEKKTSTKTQRTHLSSREWIHEHTSTFTAKTTKITWIPLWNETKPSLFVEKIIVYNKNIHLDLELVAKWSCCLSKCHKMFSPNIVVVYLCRDFTLFIMLYDANFFWTDSKCLRFNLLRFQHLVCWLDHVTLTIKLLFFHDIYFSSNSIYCEYIIECLIYWVL